MRITPEVRRHGIAYTIAYRIGGMNTLTQRLDISHLLLQAPMAGSQGSALALAVSAAGGIGSLPAAMLSPEALVEELTRLAQGATGPWNVNFFCHRQPTVDPAREARWRELLAPFYREAGLDPSEVPAGAGRMPFSHEIADRVEPFRPPIVSFHFGLPAPDLLARVKAWGSVVLATATTVEEAKWLELHGADAVIAQGVEAGGHRGMFLTEDLNTQMGTLALVPQIVSAVRLPVIAAGGIADAAGVRAALALGAVGVQVGTAYLCCHEASTSAVHRAALQHEGARLTALTNLFSGRPARGIVNRLMRELGPLHPAAPAFPLAGAALAPLRAHAEARGRGDFSPLWAGQNASRCKSVAAVEITRELLQGFLPTH